MPGNNPSPIPGFLTELNLRGFSGVTLFSRSEGGNVVMPSFTGTEGRYEDWLDFLNGRASQINRDFSSLASNSFVATTFTVGLDSSDLVYVESDLENFTILASATALGFDGTETTTGAGPGPYRLTANDNWTRGLLKNVALSLSANTSGIFSVPTGATNTYWSQSVITALRELTKEGDADDPSSTALVLETVDNTALTTTTERIRWMVNDTGHITWAAPTSIASSAISWNSANFRDLMGFSGNETVDTAGNISSQTAEFPAQACIIPTRPLERITRSAERVDAAVRLTNGRIAGNEVGTYQSVELEWWMDGPVDSRDLHRHWTTRVVPYLVRGARVSWYGEWGDPRRGLISFGVKGTQATYDLLYTSEKDGERGRFRGRVAVSWSGEQSVNWPGRMRRRAPIRITLDEAEE